MEYKIKSFAYIMKCLAITVAVIGVIISIVTIEAFLDVGNMNFVMGIAVILSAIPLYITYIFAMGFAELLEATKQINDSLAYIKYKQKI